MLNKKTGQTERLDLRKFAIPLLYKGSRDYVAYLVRL